MPTPPLYAETAEALGWSPAEVSPPFDLAKFVADSYALADAKADAQ